MTKSYKHLTYEQRCQIYILKESENSVPEIAQILGVDKSTIYRELNRNSGKNGYQPQEAERNTKGRRHKISAYKMTEEMITIIEEKLRQDWSPEQIAGWLKKEQKSFVSHETIYRYIWEDKKQGGTLYKHLRHSGKKYNKRSKGTAGRGCIPNRVGIEERPLIVEEKSRFGDFELDTIIGANHKGVLVSMVDRASKLTKLVRVDSKEAAVVTEAIIQALLPFKQELNTLTADNGKEFSHHGKVSKELDVQFYFARPYHSWERGLNEHTNGLVRQYFPKGMSFIAITDEEVAFAENQLNTRLKEKPWVCNSTRRVCEAIQISSIKDRA